MHFLVETPESTALPVAPEFPHQLPAIPGDESFQPENDAIPDGFALPVAPELPHPIPQFRID